MSIYVMSDIHGYYNTFLNSLKTINFSNNDVLYILGDVIDRGLRGVDILKYIIKESNINLLMGNHEYMCINYFSETSTETDKRRWNKNGNNNTLKGFDALNDNEKNKVFDFLKSLPVEEYVSINNKKYHLVHGFCGEDIYQKVWNRPNIDTIAPNINNETLIVGHTPVCNYICPGTDEDMYVFSHNLTKRNEFFKIFHGNGFINIDCCVGYGFSAARLGILRLDDLEEYYEPVVEDI